MARRLAQDSNDDMPNDLALLNQVAALYGVETTASNDDDALNAIAATFGVGPYGNTLSALNGIAGALGVATAEHALAALNNITAFYGGEPATSIEEALTTWTGATVSTGPTLDAIYVMCDNERIYKTNQALTDDWQEIATAPIVSVTGEDDFIVTPTENIVLLDAGATVRFFNGTTWSQIDGVARGLAVDPVGEQIFISDNGGIRSTDFAGAAPTAWRGAGSLASGIAVDPIARRLYWLEYIDDDYVRINLDKTGFSQTSLGFEFGDFNQTGRADPEHGYIYFIEENTSGADHVYRLTIADNSFEELLPGNFSVSNQSFAPLRIEDAVAVAQLGAENTLQVISTETLLPIRSKVAPANIVAIFVSFTEAPVE